MMSTRERRIATVALLLSVIVHAGVGASLFNQPISQDGSRLFEAAADRRQPARVYRAPDDAAYRDPEPVARLDEAPAETPEQQDEAVREAAERMLNREDQAPALIEDVSLPTPPEFAADIDRLMAPAPDRPVDPGTPEGADATGTLISESDPTLVLPEFVGPTDEIDLPEPTETGQAAGGGGPGGDGNGGAPGAGGALSARALNAALAETAATAERAIAGPFELGETESELQAAAPQPAQPELALDIAPETLPDLSSRIEGPPNPAVDPPVDISDAVNPSLRIYDRALKQGFTLFGGGDKKHDGPGWFELAIRTRRAARPVKPLNKDVVYVVDVSSSIGQRWLKAIKAGVIAGLQSLDEGDRFNVVMFSTEVRPFNADGLVQPSDEALKAAAKFIEEAESSGYTDVNKALRELVRGDPGDARVYQVIFISDGRPTSGTIGPRQIIDIFTRANDLVAGVYAVAVGDKVNLPLIGSLAYRNKGYVERPENWMQTTGVLRDLASRLRKPIVKNAAINAAGVDTRMLFPKGPLDIYQDDPFRLRGRYTDEDEAISVRITGRNREQRIAFGERVRFNRAVEGDRAIAEAWARAYANYLTTQMLTASESEREALEKQVDQIGDKYGLW